MKIYPPITNFTSAVPVGGSLRVYIDYDSITALKRFIKENHQSIKPGHIVESIARGLAFPNGYNDLRYALDNAVPADISEKAGIRVDVDEAAFVNFLEDRGYANVPKDLFRRALWASTAVALREVKGKVTKLVVAAYQMQGPSFPRSVSGGPSLKPFHVSRQDDSRNEGSIDEISDSRYQQSFKKRAQKFFERSRGPGRPMPHGVALFVYEESRKGITESSYRLHSAENYTVLTGAKLMTADEKRLSEVKEDAAKLMEKIETGIQKAENNSNFHLHEEAKDYALQDDSAGETRVQLEELKDEVTAFIKVVNQSKPSATDIDNYESELEDFQSRYDDYIS